MRMKQKPIAAAVTLALLGAAVTAHAQQQKPTTLDTITVTGIRASVEGLWSKTMEDVFYYNVNREATGTFGALDHRPQFQRLGLLFLGDVDRFQKIRFRFALGVGG